MPRSKPETVICTYRVKKGKEAAFLRKISRHWPTLRKLKLVTSEPPMVFRGTDKAMSPVIVEIFTWKDGKAAGAAHEIPEVMELWEAMDPFTEERFGRPKWEFPHFQPVKVKFAKV